MHYNIPSLIIVGIFEQECRPIICNSQFYKGQGSCSYSQLLLFLSLSALVEYTPKEPPQLEPSASASNSLSLELASMIMTTTIPVISPTPTPGPINNDVAVEVDTPPVSLDEIVPTRKLSPCPYPAGLNEILKNIPKGKSVFWERLFISDGGKVLEC